MKYVMLLLSMLLVSCADDTKEKIKGGGPTYKEGVIYGKPASKYYEQFKFYSEIGEKERYWYLQSTFQELDPNTAWSVDIKLVYQPKPQYKVRVNVWKKFTNGDWGLAEAKNYEGKWFIDDIFMVTGLTIGRLSPHSDANGQYIRFTFDKKFQDPVLKGQSVNVKFAATDREI